MEKLATIKKKVNSKHMPRLIPFLVGCSGFMIYFAWDDSFNMQVISPIILLVFFIYLLKSKFTIHYTKSLKVCTLLICVYCISFVTNSVINIDSISLDSIIRIIYTIIIILYFAIVTDMDFSVQDIKFILIANVWVAVFCACLILLNYFNGAVGKISMKSFFGTELEENYLGSLLAFDDLLCLLFVLKKRGALKKILYALCFTLVFVAICLTGCRSALIAVVGGVLILIVYLLFSRKIKLIYKISILLFLFIGVYLFLKYAELILPSNIYERIFSIIDGGLNDNSNSERVALWKYAIQNFIYRPLFGYGIGNFTYYVKLVPEFSHHSVVVAHNTWLDFLMDSGLIGFLLTCYLIFHKMGKLFSKKGILVWALLFCWLITSFIVGGERTFFFWNEAMILVFIAKSMGKARDFSVFE